MKPRDGLRLRSACANLDLEARLLHSTSLLDPILRGRDAHDPKLRAS